MIKCRRKELKITQKELARKLKISEAHLNRIENKKFTNLNLNLLFNLSKELNIDVHSLLNFLVK